VEVLLDSEDLLTWKPIHVPYGFLARMIGNAVERNRDEEERQALASIKTTLGERAVVLLQEGLPKRPCDLIPDPAPEIVRSSRGHSRMQSRKSSRAVHVAPSLNDIFTALRKREEPGAIGSAVESFVKSLRISSPEAEREAHLALARLSKATDIRRVCLLEKLLRSTPFARFGVQYCLGSEQDVATLCRLCDRADSLASLAPRSREAIDCAIDAFQRREDEAGIALLRPLGQVTKAEAERLLVALRFRPPWDKKYLPLREQVAVSLVPLPEEMKIGKVAGQELRAARMSMDDSMEFSGDGESTLAALAELLRDSDLKLKLFLDAGRVDEGLSVFEGDMFRGDLFLNVLLGDALGRRKLNKLLLRIDRRISSQQGAASPGRSWRKLISDVFPVL
jgi:hypothetical protein